MAVVKLNIGSLPLSLKLNQVIGIGILGGLGFTISIFMSVLAFDQQRIIDQSKLSVLIASFSAGIIGFMYLNRVLYTKPKN